MFLKNRLTIFLSIAGIAAICVAILSIIHIYNSGFSTIIGATVGAAILSLTALANSALGSAATESRSQFANAFSIAKRWDEAPIVNARDVLRPYLKEPETLVDNAKNDEKTSRALIDFLNFYWDMSAAVELKWADPSYLKLRFGVTLESLYPAFKAFVEVSDDGGATAAFNSISLLRDNWNNDVLSKR